MSFERIHVSVVDRTRPLGETPFNIPLILGTTTDEEAVKDTLKIYSSDDLTAIAADFPTTTAEYKAAVKLLAQDPHPETVYIYSKTRTATPIVTDLSDALTEVIAACEAGGYAKPYFVALSEHEEVEGDQAELADSVSAQMMYLLLANETGLTASQCVAQSLAINSDRVLLVAHDDPDNERPDMGLMGLWAGSEVGSLTLTHKPLNSVATSYWSTGDMATFAAKMHAAGACIPYITQAGVPMTIGSEGTNGTFADLRRCKDWLKVRMEESLLGLLVRNAKIPQTTHGLNMVQGALEGVLNRALEKQIVQPRGGSGGRWEISIPTMEWLAANDPTALANRHLRTIRVRVWPVGAWEEFTVIVYLSWELAS